jgi:phenylalanyl-tRNA synthetase beta chain
VHVAAAAAAPTSEAAFFRLKGALEALLAALKLPVEPTATESVRVVDEAIAAFELDLDELLAARPGTHLYEDVITFPALKQDLAFVVDEGVRAGDLVDAARAAAGPELREMRPFDVYRGEQVGEGRKSVAFAVSFQSPERTLSDEDAAVLRGRITEALAERFDAHLRE